MSKNPLSQSLCASKVGISKVLSSNVRISNVQISKVRTSKVWISSVQISKVRISKVRISKVSEPKIVFLTFLRQVTSRQTSRTVNMRPAAIPVTITTMELGEEASDQSNTDLLPLTALESVTPRKEGRKSSEK